MGAGQIGGIATMLDMDFNNAAGFVGHKADITEAQYMVYFLSHAMMFCAGIVIEPHVVLTPALCVSREKYQFDIYAGTHYFLENYGVRRTVQNLCVNRSANKTLNRKEHCGYTNLALLVLAQQYSFRDREVGSQFPVNRLRYGKERHLNPMSSKEQVKCVFYGWGSRRNGFLVPLLINLYRVEVELMPLDYCKKYWPYKDDRYLCIKGPSCANPRHGALCPDDLGSVLDCNGFAEGIMVSAIMDRPCGVGFLDLNKNTKFLTCGVDDSREFNSTSSSFVAEYFNNMNIPSVTTVPTTQETPAE